MNHRTERTKGVMSGALVIKGTRVLVSRILFLLAQGTNIETIVKINYPFLTVETIKGAIEEIAKDLENFGIKKGEQK